MKKLVSTLIATTALISSASVFAGTAEVTWSEPDNYSDVRPANESRKAFQKRTFKALDKHIGKMTEKKLPDGYTLKMDVVDLNLAGDVQLRGSTLIRVVDRVFIPSMEFSYSLSDANGKVVKEESGVKLKDMSFMDSIKNARYRHESLSYEKAMLDEWFKENLAEFK